MLRVFPHARVIAGAVIASLVLALALPTVASADPGNKPSKKDRELVAAAVANGESTVTMLFATSKGATGAVASALRALGATVRKEEAAVGYIRANVPTDQVDAAAKISGVLGSEVDQVWEIGLPDATDGGDVQVDPPGPTTPSQNPFMPTRDIGAPQFVAAHPTFDGRGTTIGILDTGVDLGHPALQTTSTGERKIIDWLTYTDAATDGDPSWVRVATTVTIAGGTFTVGARTWTGAPNGTFRFGTFSEDHPTFANVTATAAEYRVVCTNRALVPAPPPAAPGTFLTTGGDLNRNGICGEVFAFLWDGADTVWRDSDADGDFSDEVGMKPYKTAFEVGEYGHDNPATPIRESVPFVTQIDAAAGFVSLGIVSGAHGSHVAGIAAGNNFFGGAYDGVAPGAKIISVRVCLFTSGCTSHALIEGMIFLTAIADVDVVNMSIGGLPSLNDGNNARAILYNRLIDEEGAQLFLSAGNSGPGVNTVGDPSVATKVMSIGAYWHKDTVLANYGNVVPGPEALHDFSSRGPREDGGFKPQVIAPGSAVSSVPTWQAGQPVAGTYPLPPGYAMFNGTSMASPQAAGAGALLLSGLEKAKRRTPALLRQALNSSARFLTNELAHEQGNGLINVGAAYDLLTTSAQKLKPVEMTSAVPVNTKLSAFLATPGIGTGIYDREGVSVGSAPYTRTYTFSTSDPGNRTYDLRWIGNDGTFSLPGGVTSLNVGKNKSATLAVKVTPGAAGVHSAILVLDDPTFPGIEYETMNTVIVSIPLNAANAYKASVSGSASKFQAGDPKIFFTVPDGTTAMRMTLEITNTGRVNATAQHPYGVPVTGAQAIPFTTGPAPVTRIVTTGPIPGTWEVASAASRATQTAGVVHPDTATYKITYEAFRVTLSPNPWRQSPAAIGTPYSQVFTATNAYAAATTVQTADAFASVSTTTATISDVSQGGTQQFYDLQVPSGTTSLTVSLGGATDPGADLDLFLYSCPAGTPAGTTTGCTLRGVSAGSTSVESITITSPLPVGLWRSVVDPFAVPAGSTGYTYTDQLANPAYGSVTVPANAPTARTSGESWTFTATGTATASAGAPGRFLRATVAVRINSSTGSILGSAFAIFITS